MRTTLTIQEEYDSRLRKIAREQNRSYKEVVNEAIAHGLNALEIAEPVGEYRVRARSYGLKAGVDRTRLNQLYDKLEASE